MAPVERMYSRSNSVGEEVQNYGSSHLSPASERISLMKPALTPATMSSSGSSPSRSSPLAAQETSTTMTSSAAEDGNQASSGLNNSYVVPAGPHTMNVLLSVPSPSRPRLDTRYAARLPPTPTSSAARSQSTTPRASESELMPPPGIARDCNLAVFRPTPICTSLPTEQSPARRAKEHFSPIFFPSSATSYSSTSSAGASGFASPRTRRSKRSAADVGVSDRFIPSRATSNFNFNLWESPSNRRGESSRSQSNSNGQDERDEAESSTGGSTSTTSFYTQLLRSELLGENENSHSGGGSTTTSQSRSSSTPLREGRNNLRFQSPRQQYQENVFEEATGPGAIVSSFSLTPVRSAASQRLMAAPPKRKRRISKVPFKVLDAPALQDDFYLNLVDWSSQNVLAVGLGSCVYLWSACTSKVTKLCDLSASEDGVTAVSWAQRGTHLAVGTNRGEVQIWDTLKCKRVRTMNGHSARVGTLAWTGPVLASGSRDRLIYLRDVRVQAAYTDKLSNHKQEVCGLKWSFDEPSFLASGGNDNNLHVIDSRNPSNPVHRFVEHTAAVKAIAWSPHQHGLLGSGGGTADRCIRFWNTLSGASLNKIDTGSQVCNLSWSQNCNEIVSTHGYSLNQIVVWRYPSMSKVVTLTGHTYRVLYLAMSPDGSTVVTGAGDETLRFWQIFPGPRSDGKDGSGGLLFPNTLGSVVR